MTVSEKSAQKLTFATMTAMVVGSMVGAGVFSLPRRFAQETGDRRRTDRLDDRRRPGMLMLAFVFQTLAVRKPDLDAGVYAYAKAGFGEYLGFFSAFGYWASACVGNVTYWVLIMSTVGRARAGPRRRRHVARRALSTVGIWVFYMLIRRGVKEAAVINRIVTIAKVDPDPGLRAAGLFVPRPAGLRRQLERPRRRAARCSTRCAARCWSPSSCSSASRAPASTPGTPSGVRTSAGPRSSGFLMRVRVFASVTIVSYGILPHAEIAELRQPSMAGVLEAAVGEWGKVFVSVGLIVSVLGAYLAWTLMAAEVLFVAARDDDMPRFLRRANPARRAGAALLMTTVLVQVMLVVTLFSEDAFNFALDLTSALTLIPFLLAAGYALKLVATRETYDERAAGLRAASWSWRSWRRCTPRSCCSRPGRSSSWSRSSSTRRPRSCS